MTSPSVQLTLGPRVGGEPHPALAGFHPAVAEWFRRRFPEGPTTPQAEGWPHIAAGHDTLIAAPTGSGKTLSGFLVCIDRLYRAHERGDEIDGSTRVVYVSPLKALAVDIAENLERPLAEIAAVAQELGLDAPKVRVAVRTGDSTSSERAAMLRRPPSFVVTTPESLYLLVTSAKGREMLRTVDTVIVDEIHAVARDKRGAHLAVTLERLEAVCEQPPQRVGLSATQRPVETVARLLVGTRPTPHIVDAGHQRNLDLALELPEGELEAVTSAEQMGDVIERIAELVGEHHTTLVFVNTRRLAERLAHQLGERLGDGAVAAHHGSLSKERRHRVETRLRAGDLRALVATASLELGIDIGPVELVCQIGSPRSIATFLQRVGRSNHSRAGTPKGRLFPLTRDELVECTALLSAVHAGKLDAIQLPRLPLDILAQQIVAETGAQEWRTDDLYALMRRSAPFAELERADFDEVLELVAGGIQTGRGTRGAYVHHDAINGEVRGRKGARLAALTSGGAIPENGDYRVVAEPDDTFIGTVNEDWAVESMAGDIFLLGTHSWQIRRIEAGVVRVRDAGDAPPTVPFWMGEAPARTDELSAEVSELRERIDDFLQRGDPDGARAWVMDTAGIGLAAATMLVDYLAVGRAVLGAMPTLDCLVLERFFDETGGMQLVVHSPYGGRINRALGIALRKRFCRTFNFELQAAATDNAVVLSLGPHHSFPLADVPRYLSSQAIDDTLEHAILDSPMFQARWRWNLNRSLMVLRFRNGRKNPPPIQRMEADDLMVAVFPQAAACQDNTVGPIEIPDHVLVRQTIADTLHESLDADGLRGLLERIEDGDVTVHFAETTEPSVLSHEILTARPYAFLDDEELQNRRTNAVTLRRGLSVDLAAIGALESAAIEQVHSEIEPDPQTPDDLHDLLRSLVFTRARDDWRDPWTEFVVRGRGRGFERDGVELWCTTEASADADRAIAGEEDAIGDVLRGHLEITGITTVAELATATTLPSRRVEAGLAVLEHGGFALQGRYTPDTVAGPHPIETEWVSRRLLARMHSYSRRTRRASVEPSTPQDFMRFLLRWQHVAPDTQLAGEAGLAAALEQLQGHEAAAVAWEPELLSRRLRHYDRAWLDRLCHDGEVSWLRLTPRANDNADTPAGPPSKATPITVVYRNDLPWLLEAARAAGDPAEPVVGGTAEIVEVLHERGACFASELGDATNRLPQDIERALWDGVARGLLTSDGFGAIRARVSSGAGARGATDTRRLSRLFRGSRAPGAAAGRWSLVPATGSGTGSSDAGIDHDELAEAVAELLLNRWGVIFRDLAFHDSIRFPWRDIQWALRRLEDRGLVRGGRFVTGFSGEQYALPHAIEQLTQVRKIARTGERVVLNATDPLNLVGLIVPGATVPSVRTRQVTYVDGVPEQMIVPEARQRVTLSDRIRKPYDTLRSVMAFEPIELDPVERRLRRAADISDLRKIARRRLPRGVFDYVDGGAEDEVTLTANTQAFRNIEFRPRVLRDVGTIDPSTTLLGRPLPIPLVLAPTGFPRSVHPDGELATARAATRAQLPYTLSTLSTYSIEEVAAAADGPHWFQVYVWRDRGLVKEMIERAAAADYEAIVLTVDTAVLGRRDRDVRHGFVMPPKLGFDTLVDGALHPAWVWNFVRSDPIRFANVVGRDVGDGSSPVAIADYINAQFDPTLSWRDVDWIRSVWDGPIVIKGIQTVADALLAADAGVEAIALSNHGGRQLDSSPATIDLVEPVVDAVGDRLEVICDGGVRRGGDIVKAVARGARACMGGRIHLYGLAAGGERGVEHALRIIDRDVRRTMALIGAKSVADITRDLVS